MAIGQFEFKLPKFLKLGNEKQVSPVFYVGGYPWQVTCYPKQNKEPREHISTYVVYTEVDSTPDKLCPEAKLTFSIVNHKRPEETVVLQSKNRFTAESCNWGFSDALPLKDATVERGYLTADGALVVRVKLEVVRIKGSTRNLSADGLSHDLVSLLDEPGGTSDLTLVAGGRSLPVHRAILIARCPFFKALLTSGLAESGEREVTLPDADPDAVVLLCRCLYGDTPACPSELLKPAAELADRWLLTGVRDALYENIAYTSTSGTIIKDLLWAEGRGAEDLVAKLQAEYVECASEVEEEDIVMLSEACPRLLARLLSAVAKGRRNVRQRTG